MASSPPFPMKNIVVPILGAISIISTGAVAWLLATPPSVDPRAGKLESELQEARQTIAKLKAELARKPAAETVAAASSAPTSSDPTAPTVPVMPNTLNMKERLSSPAMRQMIDSQQAAQVELGYGKLFEILRLSPEDKENFKKLLIARQKMQTDLSLQMMDPNLTPERRQQISDEAKKQAAVYEASIKDFLNEAQDFETFQEWDNTQPERTAFDTMGRNLFAASAEPLSGSQEQQLLSLMAEVRRSPDSIGGLNDQTGGDPSKVNDQVIQRQMEQLDTNHRIITERAGSFMTETQRQTLKTYLDQMKAITKNGMEMFRSANK
jgi:hypothetical protein